MSSLKLKSFEIQLTDIWIECQIEMIEMRDRILNLNDCLKTSELIARHLTKCNETLVTIVEKCRIDYRNNNEIIVLINSIKSEEKEIEREKQNLNTLKSKDYMKDKQKVFDLIQNWNQCKPLSASKGSQTLFDETLTQNHFKSDPKLNEKHLNSDSDNENVVNNENISDLLVKSESGIESQIRDIFENSLSNDLIEKSSQIDIDSKSDVLSDREDQSVDFDVDYRSDDNSDSDFEFSSKSNKRNKNNSQISERQKRINEVVLPLKVDNQFVCNQTDCGFTSCNKRNFYRHMKRHENNCFNSMNCIEKSERQQRMDDLVLDLKVDNKYVCNESNCDFESTNKRIFYRHMRGHQNPIHGLKTFNERLERQKQIDETIDSLKVDNKYVCNESECDFSTNSRKLFRKHYQNHQKLKEPKLISTLENPRPFVCDWPGCESKFKHRQHLHKHKSTTHLNLKPYVCDWPGCGFKMAGSHHFKLHRMTHTKEKPRKCDWPGCEFMCVAQWSLVAHKRKHTGEKPYACPWPDCNYRCSQPCTLISHKRKHTGEKPYVCSVKECGKSFSSLAGIHTHRKLHNKQKVNKRTKIVDNCETSNQMTEQTEI